MKLIKNDYIIEGTPKEINEFLESELKEESSKVNNNSVSKDKFILARDAYLFYVNPYDNPHNGRWNRDKHLPNRCFLAPKGTILEHVGYRYYDMFGKKLSAPLRVYKDISGIEVTVSLSDKMDGAIKKIETESMSDLMEIPLKELIEMAKSVFEKGE